MSEKIIVLTFKLASSTAPSVPHARYHRHNPRIIRSTALSMLMR